MYEALLGIPYKLNGRDRDGTDCLGLVHLYFKAKGFEFPDGDGEIIDEGWRENAVSRMVRFMEKIGRPTDRSAENVVLIFRMPRGQGGHLGVMVDDRHFLHILEDQPSEITELNYRWRRRLVAAYEIPVNKKAAPTGNAKGSQP